MKRSYFGICLLLLAAVAGAQAAEVRLRSSATARAPIVRLSDVAEIFVDDPAIAEGLSLIALCPAPKAGGERFITQHELRQILVQSGVERKMVLVTGSERVTVLAHAPPLLPRAISRSYDSAEAIQPVAFVPAESAASPPRKPAAAEPAPVPDVPEPAPKLVTRGTHVTVLARASGVRVTTSGKALAHGAADETIAVELDDSREKVLARIVGPQTVEVAVGRSIAPNKAVSVPVEEVLDE